MAGYLSAVNLIASAGILGNVGGVPITANANVITNISNYNTLAVVSQFANVKSSGSAVLSPTTTNSLNNLAGNTFPGLTNAVPSSYTGSLGNTSVAGLTGLVSTGIDDILGNGDLGIFEQVFSLADGYKSTTNQLINSSVNANNASANSTYTTQDNTLSGGISQISQAYQAFGADLVALGYSIDFASLSDIGSPQALLKQIYSQTGGSTTINTDLLNAGISQNTLYNLSDVPMTDEEQKIVYDVMTTITGNKLNQILYVLKVTTAGLTALSDLLNPVKMFPNSFNTLTAPTVNGLRGIYINSSGAINTNLITTLPSNVLAPVQGYQTVQNTYSQLKKIIPPDWALANKALQAGFQQVKSIFGTTAPILGAAISALESNKGLNLINSLTSPLPSNVSDYFDNTYGQGTGENGTLLLADIIGSAGGWVVNGNLSSTTTIISSMTSAGSLTTLTNASTGVYTIMQNVIDGFYGDIANSITIPAGKPGAGTYTDGNVAFTGPGTPGTGLIPAAYSLIANIIANNSSNVTVANSNWSNIASQLVIQNATQAQAGIVYANLIPGVAPTSLASDIGQYGLDTAVGGAAWLFDSIANTSTQGGQAIVSSMREARNQELLSRSGVGTDIVVDDVVPTPQISVSPGQYTVSEAESQKII